MDGGDVVSWRRRAHGNGAFDSLRPSEPGEAHVLAVDDSLVDRKVIERLLRISSFKGNRVPLTSCSSELKCVPFLLIKKKKKEFWVLRDERWVS